MISRHLSGRNCRAANFASQHLDASPALWAIDRGCLELSSPVSRKSARGTNISSKIRDWRSVYISGVNKSARERIGRQNLSQKVPSKKGSLGVIFSPRNCRENAHSKSANFEGRHSGATCSAGPFCLLPNNFGHRFWWWVFWSPEALHKRGRKTHQINPLRDLRAIFLTFARPN